MRNGELDNISGTETPDGKPLRQWIIQRCIDAFANHYQDWPSYSEKLMTREEMIEALNACEQRWPDFAFRGHNVVNQKPGSDRLRCVS
jgi:hypothetical protein